MLPSSQGYPVDLDEYEADCLIKELERRRLATSKGLCDYCRRPIGSGKPCRFPERHSGKQVVPRVV
ncbi:MAG: hypothetical protein HY481_00190 [Candidatus Vogelbacteria bacterium]|nr:hypothetical protein [Candidatus Vogelbacteria bacterium]